MVRGILVALGLFALSMPLGAQISGGPYWPGDCSAAVRLKNNTGLSLGAVWMAIRDDDLNNPVEIESILLTDPSGIKVWDVDDNEDGDNDDGEADFIDGTARGNPEGWHRVQARTGADVIVPGNAYKITLCGENSKSLQFRPVEFFFAKPGVVGGDDGIFIASPPLTISAAGGDEVQVTLLEDELPPLTEFTFSFVLKNGFTAPLDKVKVFARQTSVTVLNVTSDIGGTHDLPTKTYTFATPLPVGASAEMTFTLNGLADPTFARVGSTTEIVFQKVTPPVVPSLATLPEAVAILARLDGKDYVVEATSVEKAIAAGLHPGLAHGLSFMNVAPLYARPELARAYGLAPMTFETWLRPRRAERAADRRSV